MLLHFDFGPSFTSYPKPVSEIILAAMPWTIGLLVTSTVIAWLLGNLVGIIAGYYNKRRFATALEVVGIVLYPIPYYVLALTVVLVLAYYLGWFPITSTFLPGPLTPQRVIWILYNSALPALTLILAGFGWNILSMKSLAVATKEEGYVQFARLKGVPDWRRMNRYVFRNALLPQLTALVLSLGTIFNGALLTEMIFAYPGIGLLMRTAAGAGDYNLLYGTITTAIIAVATAAFILDLIYPLFDPRIRLKG
ncbi:MAG: ABC transporter permease [Actinobacteria bacterium]|nr:ABC transporter permease [Actinomycetota bacterium]